MDYYDSISRGYEELHMEEQLKKLRIIKARISVRKKTRLLDIGCGSGISSDFGCFVVGLDPSIGLLKQNKNKKKVSGIAEHLPFKDNSFDIVISVTAIQNFGNVEKALEEMKRVCNGKFVISVLKKSKKLDAIRKLIEQKFIIGKVIEEETDVIFFLDKPAALKS